MNKYLDPSTLNKFPNKLIRDKIPNIIVSENKTCTFRKLEKEEIFNAQKTKVLEELDELKQAIEKENINEINEETADFIEILSYWQFGTYSPETLKYINKNIELKDKTNGSFKENYFLEKVEFNK